MCVTVITHFRWAGIIAHRSGCEAGGGSLAGVTRTELITVSTIVTCCNSRALYSTEYNLNTKL